MIKASTGVLASAAYKTTFSKPSKVGAAAFASSAALIASLWYGLTKYDNRPILKIDGGKPKDPKENPSFATPSGVKIVAVMEEIPKLHNRDLIEPLPEKLTPKESSTPFNYKLIAAFVVAFIFGFSIPLALEKALNHNKK